MDRWLATMQGGNCGDITMGTIAMIFVGIGFEQKRLPKNHNRSILEKKGPLTRRKARMKVVARKSTSTSPGSLAI
jgi:hypothetical protein